MTKKDFHDNAKAAPVTVDGKKVTPNARDFKTGSQGWFTNEVVDVKVNGETLKARLNMSLVVLQGQLQ